MPSIFPLVKEIRIDKDTKILDQIEKGLKELNMKIY